MEQFRFSHVSLNTKECSELAASCSHLDVVWRRSVRLLADELRYRQVQREPNLDGIRKSAVSSPPSYSPNAIIMEEPEVLPSRCSLATYS